MLKSTRASDMEYKYRTSYFNAVRGSIRLIPYTHCLSLFFNRCRLGNKPQERFTRMQDSGHVFRMELHTYIPRMVLELEYFHTKAFFVLTNKLKAGCAETLDVFRTNLISMTMALADDFLVSVQLSYLRSISSFLEDSWSTTKSHSECPVDV
jgi:hypothetical protein